MKLQTMFLVKQIESGPIETLLVMRQAISFTDMLAAPVNPTQPDVSDHGRDLTGGKSYPPYKFSIKTVQMTIKFML